MVRLMMVLVLVLGLGCQPAEEENRGKPSTTQVGELSDYSFEELLKLQEEGAITQEVLTAEVTRRLMENEAFLAEVKGPQGPEGPAGTAGEPGPVGEQGLQGNPGSSLTWLGSLAEDPLEPARNQAYYNPADGVAYVYDGVDWMILARDGKVGAQGEVGEAGPEGQQGTEGLAGAVGEPGPVGKQGPRGEQGLGVLDVPSIVSVPPETLDSTVAFEYQVGTNGGQGPYYYYLMEGPAEASLEVATGLLTWQPQPADVGVTHGFGLVVLDSAGLVGGQRFELTVVLTDLLAPTNLTIMLNHGETSTDRAEVTVTLTAEDNWGVSGYCLREEDETPVLGDACWEEVAVEAIFNAEVGYALSAGAGEKTVYVWFRDENDNLAGPAMATILREVVVPELLTNEWVPIPNGSFQMGQEEIATPVHQVTLSAYMMLKYEVTAGEYKACVDAGVCTYNGSTSGDNYTYNRTGNEAHPINEVNWYEARTYCQWLDGDLPTEAQWEYAARGSDGRTYPWGNESPEVTKLNYNGNVGITTPVQNYPMGVSPFGLHDMAGNVWEWVADWYGNYSSEALVDPVGPESGTGRGLRGGSYDSDNVYVRAAERGSNFLPGSRDYRVGFRCAAPQD
ncbi:MAG: hypothetical protein A2284_04375 [Deltaproteobacteria bacterium RIFOXYA12_FULL_61_11]|nr:MAG: hypothetical protein A2284_04375 [Deltaproteobacteria bacterium RIFOXYA12_FULL_61_11]